MKLRHTLFIAALALGLFANLGVPAPMRPLTLPAGMKANQSPYYTVFSDLPPEATQEAVLRMTRMAEEYNERTKGFAGAIKEKLPFYLFQRRWDYTAAGAPTDSSGVYIYTTGGKRLMALAGDEDDQRRWRVVQHEGFHQFADATIGDLPTWLNEGMAEYFGESIWTGDGFVTGIIPPGRLKRLREEIYGKKLHSLPDMMLVTPKEWNATLMEENYDQAWSMAHFLAQGDNAKYRPAFEQFMQALSKKQPMQRAWDQAFGSVDGFEKKWADWWLNLPDDPSAELYTRATLSTLTSFIARAYAQKQVYPDLDQFLLAAKGNDLKFKGNDWLPPALLQNAITAMSRDETRFSIGPSEKGQPPKVFADRPDGTRLVATFPARHSLPVKITIKATPNGAIASGRNPRDPDLGKLAPPVRPSPPEPAPRHAQPPADQPPAGRPPASRPSAPQLFDPAAPPPDLKLPPATATSIAGLAPFRESILQYVAQHNEFGPEHQIVTDAAKHLDQADESSQDSCFFYGAKVMKSEHALEVVTYGSEAFIIEFTDDQAVANHMTGANVTALRLDRVASRRADPPVVEIAIPRLAENGPIEGGQSIKGKVSARGLDKLKGEYALRVTYRGKHTSNTEYLTYDGHDANTALAFELKGPTEGVDGPAAIMALVDICRVAKQGDKVVRCDIMSNTAAFLIDFVPPTK